VTDACAVLDADGPRIQVELERTLDLDWEAVAVGLRRFRNCRVSILRRKQ
jgi:hypothetical protein